MCVIQSLSTTMTSLYTAKKKKKIQNYYIHTHEGGAASYQLTTGPFSLFPHIYRYIKYKFHMPRSRQYSSPYKHKVVYDSWNLMYILIFFFSNIFLLPLEFLFKKNHKLNYSS